MLVEQSLWLLKETAMIAIIEDDETIAILEQYALSTIGMQAEIFPDGKSFFHVLQRETPELVILDVMLPDLDGYEILKRLRGDPRTVNLPVMMVTAKGAELDVVQGLDEGADDYLPKPFGIREFLSRTKALLRRSQRTIPVAEETKSVLSFGSIRMDEGRHQVMVEQDSIELTIKEYELLKLLLKTPEKAVSRETIMNQVWDCEASLESRTLDMHIRTLRQKLGRAGGYIHTLRKVGYILTEERN